MKLFLLSILFVGASLASPVDVEFELFKATHGKTYNGQEEHEYRKGVFADNSNMIKKHNQEAAAGLHTFTLGINEFADMTHNEFLSKFTTTMAPVKPHSAKLEEVDVSDLPTSVDWRDHGLVTEVKNQGNCGSCWAFSTTGSVEGAHAKATGELVSLSEEQLVACSKKNSGCHGGLPDLAFEYVIQNGLMSENDYPYNKMFHFGSCKLDKTKVVATISSYQDVAQGNELALQKATSEVGPISIGIDASHNSFQFYQDGVYNPSSCSRTRLDHGVLIVGYGNTEAGDFWMVKNSWGPTWGLDGYIMMARNENNKCGIATMASYPIV